MKFTVHDPDVHEAGTLAAGRGVHPVEHPAFVPDVGDNAQVVAGRSILELEVPVSPGEVYWEARRWPLGGPAPSVIPGGRARGWGDAPNR